MLTMLNIKNSILSMLGAKNSILNVEEFNTNSEGFVIPGHIITHKNQEVILPTLFWCHGGPHNRSDLSHLIKIAKTFNVNVVGFDFRGSIILPNYYKNVEHSNYDSNSVYYKSIDRDFGGGHMRDLEAVVNYVKSNNNLNSEKFIIAGQSFGGYMVALALVTPDLSKYFKLGIACSGFYDLGKYKYDNTDPNQSDARKQVPYLYANDVDKKIIIIHGSEKDSTTLVSREGAERFIHSLEICDKKVITHFVEKANHNNLDFVNALNEVFKSKNLTIQELVEEESSLLGIENSMIDNTIA